MAQVRLLLTEKNTRERIIIVKFCLLTDNIIIRMFLFHFEEKIKSMTYRTAIQSDFHCPITQDIMQDPVLLVDDVC